jgi:hypothetical protein
MALLALPQELCLGIDVGVRQALTTTLLCELLYLFDTLLCYPCTRWAPYALQDAIWHSLPVMALGTFPSEFYAGAFIDF